MKLFVLTSAVLLLSIAESVEPKSAGQLVTGPNAILDKVSSQINSLDVGVKKLALDLEKTITDLRTRYGSEKFVHYQIKYLVKSFEFNLRPELNKACSEHVNSIVRRNSHLQTVLSNSILDNLKSWREGYNRLDKMILDGREAISSLEKYSHECGESFNGNGQSQALSCTSAANNKASDIVSIILIFPYGVQYELDNLVQRKNEAIGKLNEDLEDLFDFYDGEKEIDDYLNKTCPK